MTRLIDSSYLNMLDPFLLVDYFESDDVNVLDTTLVVTLKRQLYITNAIL